MHNILCIYIYVRFSIHLIVCLYTYVCSDNGGNKANVAAYVE